MNGEGPWWYIQKFLEPSRRNGYRLNGNLGKFQVSRMTVEVLEFFINKKHWKLVQNILNIFMDLTALWNRSKLRLVFSRVNHTARYSQLQELETLSQPLLFWSSKLYGNKELQSVVEQAKRDMFPTIRTFDGIYSQDKGTELWMYSSYDGI